MDVSLETTLDEAQMLRACSAARRHADSASGPHDALDGALDALRAAGSGLLCSIFILEHDRLWLVSQRGYSSVPDGLPLTKGIMGRALRSGDSQHVADAGSDPDYVPGSVRAVGEAAVPLVLDDTPLGVLNVETFAPFPAAVEAALDGLGAALAPRVAELGTTLDVSALARLFIHSTSLRDVGDAAQLAARSLGRVLDLEYVQVGVRGEQGARIVAQWSRPEAPAPAVDVEALVERAGEAGDATVLATLAVEGSGDGLVVLPLRARGTTIGAVAGRRNGHGPVEREAGEVATLIAAHTAAVIDVAQALEAERRAASTDALTGVLNRRAFDALLAAELDAAQELAGTVALVLVDCDDLKAVNDARGHAAGDALLCELSACLARVARSCDAVARIGGDEFVVVLPETGYAQAQRTADRIRRAATGSVSVGFAVSPSDGLAADELLRAADRRLYREKRTGVRRLAG